MVAFKRHRGAFDRATPAQRRLGWKEMLSVEYGEEAALEPIVPVTKEDVIHVVGSVFVDYVHCVSCAWVQLAAHMVLWDCEHKLQGGWDSEWGVMMTTRRRTRRKRTRV